MALEDPEADGKAKAGAGTDVFGGEERIEDLFLVLFRDADAVIGHDKFDRVGGPASLNRDTALHLGRLPLASTFV